MSMAILGTISLGRAGVVRPKKSLIWVDAMSSAMPLVKPMVTGLGMKRTAAPRPVATMTTKAPEACDDGGVEAGLRRHAGGDAEGHGQGQGNKANASQHCSRAGSETASASKDLEVPISGNYLMES
jgi:hypothetical protein